MEIKMEPLKEDGKLDAFDIKHEEKSLLSEDTFEQTVNVAEQISTEDTQLSLTDVSVITVRSSEVIGKCDLHKKKETLLTIEKEQPKPYTPVPSSQTKSEDSLKTNSIPPDETDTCAALLLACLFCRPLDCLLSSVKGCSECLCWFCSSLCGCEASVLQPLLDMSHRCELVGCLGARCCLCECPLCDICLQATECLDLAMEISQMLYH